MTHVSTTVSLLFAAVARCANGVGWTDARCRTTWLVHVAGARCWARRAFRNALAALTVLFERIIYGAFVCAVAICASRAVGAIATRRTRRATDVAKRTGHRTVEADAVEILVDTLALVVRHRAAVLAVGAHRRRARGAAVVLGLRTAARHSGAVVFFRCDTREQKQQQQ